VESESTSTSTTGLTIAFGSSSAASTSPHTVTSGYDAKRFPRTFWSDV